MKTTARTNTGCSTVEVDLAKTTTERLDPLIELLAELLAQERIMELESEGGAVPRVSFGDGGRS